MIPDGLDGRPVRGMDPFDVVVSLPMIGYITIGTNDFERAIEFYDQLLATIEVKRLWKTEEMAAWGPSRQETALCLAVPHDGNPGTVGNGHDCPQGR